MVKPWAEGAKARWLHKKLATDPEFVEQCKQKRREQYLRNREIELARSKEFYKAKKLKALDTVSEKSEGQQTPEESLPPGQ